MYILLSLHSSSCFVRCFLLNFPCFVKIAASNNDIAPHLMAGGAGGAGGGAYGTARRHFTRPKKAKKQE